MLASGVDVGEMSSDNIISLKEVAHCCSYKRSALISICVHNDLILCTELEGSVSLMKFDPTRKVLELLAAVREVH